MFSFIVPVKNGLPLTRALVESVRRHNPGVEAEWIIVDSGSTDGTLEYAAALGARLIRFDQPAFNYCAALNAGAAVATGDLWIFANNDVEFRSAGDLGRVIRLFEEWPVMELLSPGRKRGISELEFATDLLNGCCWVVRPEAFRSWGGMPEALSGYGFDEVWTVMQCWKRGRAIGRLTGWHVHHVGSATFGPGGGTVTAAMRANARRLLELFDAGECVGDGNPIGMAVRLMDRERTRISVRMTLDAAWAPHLRRQGYAGARVGARTPGVPHVAAPAGPPDRQWLPWLANRMLTDPKGMTYEEPLVIGQAAGPGPPPPLLMPAEKPARPGLKARLAAWINDRRHAPRTT